MGRGYLKAPEGGLLLTFLLLQYSFLIVIASVEREKDFVGIGLNAFAPQLYLGKAVNTFEHTIKLRTSQKW